MHWARGLGQLRDKNQVFVKSTQPFGQSAAAKVLLVSVPRQAYETLQKPFQLAS